MNVQVTKLLLEKLFTLITNLFSFFKIMLKLQNLMLQKKLNYKLNKFDN